MKGLGLVVEHVAAARRGDGGVDLFAYSRDDKSENWIVQCKCWRPDTRVGPSVVRELLGTLAKYPEGTRGAIVTTSSFTPGAIREAEQSGITLIDGEQFVVLRRS